MLRNDFLCFRAKSKVCKDDIAAFTKEEASEREIDSWTEKSISIMIKVRNGREVRYPNQLPSL